MASPQQKVSFLLTGSVDNQTTEEMRGPIVQQNGAPSLTDSRNTRLSVRRGTCVRAPHQTGIDRLPAGTAAFGIVGSSTKRKHVLYTTPDQGSRVSAEDGFEPRGSGILRDEVEWGDRQSIYMPWQMSGAGQIPGVSSGTGISAPKVDGIASCYNETKDELWYAWVEQQDVVEGVRLLYVCAFDREGTLLVQPSVVMRESDNPSLNVPLGLTAHGANGVRLWYSGALTTAPTDYAYRYRTLTIQQAKPVLGAAVRVSSAGSPASSPGFWSVSAQDATYAYLAGQDTGSDAAVYKVNVVAGSAQKRVVTGAWAGSRAYASVHAMRIAGAWRVAAIFSSQSGPLTTMVLDDSLGYVLPIETGTGTAGPVAAKFLLAPQMQMSAAVFAYSFVDGDTNTPHYTQIWGRKLGGGANLHLINSAPMYWQRLYDQGAQWTVSDTESYPVFFLSRYYLRVWTLNNQQAAELTDPSIVGYVVGPYALAAIIMASPIARFGCVRGGMSPAAVDSFGYVPSATSVPRVGDDLVPSYRKKDLYGTARFAKIRVTPEQPAVAFDRDGVSIVAAALPVQWDGVRTVEYGGPLHAPQLIVEYAAAGDNNYLTKPVKGVYGFSAVFEWVDDAGLTHRSMPAVTQSLEFDGSQNLKVRVLSPDTMRTGATTGPTDIAAALYMTGPNGTAYERFAVDYVPQAGYYQLTNIISFDRPIIYSRGLAGEELVPQPPPPLRDVAIIGSRAWAIDAEVPSRVVYSKLRVAGIGFEFAPALEVVAPSAAGGVVAVRELSGTIMLFAERGIFQLSDGGPTNTGQGGSFGSPYKVSDVGTHARQSVISTPQGVLFLDNAGCYSLLAGGGVVQLPGASFTGAIVGSYLLESGEEACVVTSTGPLSAVRAYNYGLQRWTHWDLPVVPSLAAQSAITRDHGLLYAASNGREYTVDSNNVDDFALMKWETDWILLGGDFQDYVVVYELIFSAHSDGDHDLRIELLTEYDGAVATTLREWNYVEIAELFQGPARRYTLKIESVRQDARSFKVRIQEIGLRGGSNHKGCRPGAVTLVYSVDGLTYEEAIVPGALK